jgi:hypothetical protein
VRGDEQVEVGRHAGGREQARPPDGAAHVALDWRVDDPSGGDGGEGMAKR